MRARLSCFLFLLILLSASVPAVAQAPPTFETITVGTTAIGLSETTLRRGAQNATSCLLSVEDESVRFLYNGGTPTSSVGHVAPAGSSFSLIGGPELVRLRMIRVSSNATVRATCSLGTTPPMPNGISSAVAGGGGGGGDVEATVEAPVDNPLFVRISDGANPVDTFPISAPATNPVFVRLSDGADPVDAIPVTFSSSADNPAFFRLSDGTDPVDTIPVEVSTTAAAPVFVQLSDGTDPLSILLVEADPDGQMAAWLHDTRDNTKTTADKLEELLTKVITAAVWGQPVTNQGDQVMMHASDSEPTPVGAGESQRPWVDPYGRQQVNISQIGGAAPAMGAGPNSSGTQRVTIANDDDVSDFATLMKTQMVADGAATAGNPVYMGGRATSSIIGETPAANGNRIGFVGGLDRVQIVRPHSNLEDSIKGYASVTDGSATDLNGGFVAAGSGVKVCATLITVTNTSDTDTTVDIKSGSNVLLKDIAAPAHLGAIVSLQNPICTDANTAMSADPAASADAIIVNAVGFKSEL